MQGSNLVQAQQAFTFGNNGAVTPNQQPLRAGELNGNYDAAAAEQQREELHQAQGVAAAKVRPLRVDAAASFAADAAVFDPGKVIVPALALLQERERRAFVSDAAAGRLWIHAAEFLLVRSEQPPAPPTDWRQPVKISCPCEDCRALQTFVSDAQAQVTRFRMHQGRRSHVESQIRSQGLDISCVTDTQGRPQTLVCTKTRRTFQRQCEQHRADCASMSALLDAMQPGPKELSKLAGRLALAKELKPQT